jgi:hypothetical protein
MTEPKHVRIVDEIPVITLTEYEFEIDGQKYFGNPVLEVGRLQKELEKLIDENNLVKTGFNVVDRQLAESQAREARLREALEFIKESMSVVDSYECAWKALAFPIDDTALKEAIKQAKQEVIDKYEKDVRIKSFKAAKREALLEAADKCDEDYRYKVLSKHLRRMAGELE